MQRRTKKTAAKKTRARSTKRRPVNVVASVLTTFSLYCGIASIFSSISNPVEYQKAAYWILAAIVLDTLDGTVARLTHSVTEFGKELDSLSDIVCFGVAPAVLIYMGYSLEQQSTGSMIVPAGSMISIAYVIAGALRLARFNAYQSDRRDVFVGLPIPAAAATIASFALFTHIREMQVAYWVLGPLTLALAALMVSSIRYPKEIRIFIVAPKQAFRLLVLGVIAIAVFDYARQSSTAIVLLPLSVGYVLFGVFSDVYNRLKKRPWETKPDEEIVEEDIDTGVPLSLPASSKEADLPK